MQDFNKDWQFYYEGESERKTVDLPHDAMIDGTRSPKSKSGAAGAYFEGGVYVYKKTFFVPTEWEEKCVRLAFGGVYRKAKVYCNDKLVGEWAYGYSEFFVSLDGALLYGQENTVKVIADNSQIPNSRWYTGGGIYRPVSLIVKNKLHFECRGVKIVTQSIHPATVRISAKHNGGVVKLEVFDGATLVAEADGDDCMLEIPNAVLWSEYNPHLYHLKATLHDGEEVSDIEEVTFGIRKLEWSNKGFFVNGKRTLLRGGCVHHDNGILGACAYSEAEDRKVRILKEAGFNAVRFSHNPCSDAFASACDKYGVYLIDEFADMWYMRKKKYDNALDFEVWHERDLTSMVKKDYNHPSVIMYSLGNELSEPCEERGVKMTEKLVKYLHSLDSSRPVTAGINFYVVVNAAKGKGVYRDEAVENDSPKQSSEKPASSMLFNMIAMNMGPAMNKMGNSDFADRLLSPCLDKLDISGYNYSSGRYPLEGKKHPNRVVFGSETFPQDIYKNWQAVKSLPYVIGDFMWTGIDYLGEAGLGAWTADQSFGFSFEKPYPWLIADTGAIDIIGTIGAQARYASTVWELNEKPVIAVKPLNVPKKIFKSSWRGTNAVESWSWQGCEGKKAEIEVYSNADFIRLELNGKIVATKKVKACKAIFNTKYREGTLVAVALDGKKKEVGRSTLVSAGEHLQISVKSEKPTAKVGEIVFIDVSLTDANGIAESNADTKLIIETNGELLAFGSAQQKNEEKYSSNVTDTYYGRALAAVRVAKGGGLNVKVSGNGLTSQITIKEK